MSFPSFSQRSLTPRSLAVLTVAFAWMFASSANAQVSVAESAPQISSSSDALPPAPAEASSAAVPDGPAAPQASSSADYHQEVASLFSQDQYPNQGGYSRQGYHSHQSDNTIASHLAVEAGGGFAPAIGNASTWQTVGYRIALGAGWMFNDSFGVLIEYGFDAASIPSATLQSVNEPDGNVHTWSFGLTPIYYFKTSGKWGGYVTGGAGFYRKLTSFTEPVFAGDYCGYFGCYPQYQNVTLSHFSSNQAGMNGGAGATYKFNEDGHLKLFAEMRYIWVDSPKSTKSSIGTGTVEMLPVTFGLRW